MAETCCQCGRDAVEYAVWGGGVFCLKCLTDNEQEDWMFYPNGIGGLGDD